jgi:hypothetical protein
MITDALEYTEKDWEWMADMRKRGFCVTVFTPEELQGANPDQVEDRLVELGWEVIDCLKEEDDE